MQVDPGKNRDLPVLFFKILLLSEKDYTKIETSKSGKLLKICGLCGVFSEVLTILFRGLNSQGKVYKLNR